MTNPVRLDHRTVLSLNGPEAETFLHGLLTQATLGLAPDERRYGALLTPQGKVIADLILERTGEGFLIDCAAIAAPMLLKRLNLFRLRARVEIVARPDLFVTAFEGAPDPRSPEAPARRIGPAGAAAGDIGVFHAARLAAGLAEQGADFRAEEVFPADINMDLVGGVDFQKGCFVGQEVVSRMKRRGIARRRMLKARLPQGAPATPSPVQALGAEGAVEVGELTSAQGEIGLARVRIDRMAEAEKSGQPFSVGGKPLVFDHPVWLADELAALALKK